MHIKVSHGLTLVELLIAVFVLTVGISGILLFFVQSMASSQQAWEYSQAAMHADYILEDIQARPSISEIMSVNWTSWAQEENLNSLSEEQVAVEFPQAKADWLEILVNITWKHKDRPQNFEVKTSITK